MSHPMPFEVQLPSEQSLSKLQLSSSKTLHFCSQFIGQTNPHTQERGKYNSMMGVRVNVLKIIELPQLDRREEWHAGKILNN